MIGVTSFARFAGLAALPALLPRFAKTAWLSRLPEFNPFKYNSFPVNAAVQSYRLTEDLRAELTARGSDGSLARLAPILAFQSVLDATVEPSALMTTLFGALPAQGSEIVLFDINEAAKVEPLLRQRSQAALGALLPAVPRRFGVTVIGNRGAADGAVLARTTAAGAVEETIVPLGLSYPASIFSLSHVALPFPPDDGLYGADPDPAENFGLRLGTLAPRGERGALLIDVDTLTRMSCNPFFPVIESAIDRLASRRGH
jgi:hypothetical protein